MLLDCLAGIKIQDRKSSCIDLNDDDCIAEADTKENEIQLQRRLDRPGPPQHMFYTC